MPRYKPQERHSLLLPAVLSEQIVPGSFAFALQYLVDHELDLSAILVPDALCCVTRCGQVKFLPCIPTFGNAMHVTEKGQVTIPKHIRLAGSEVSFSLEGSKIVITPVGTGAKDDRRAKLRAAAARV